MRFNRSQMEQPIKLITAHLTILHIHPMYGFRLLKTRSHKLFGLIMGHRSYFEIENLTNRRLLWHLFPLVHSRHLMNDDVAQQTLQVPDQ